MKKRTLLINPVSPVHARGVTILEKNLSEFHIRCIYNPLFPWYRSGERYNNSEPAYFSKNIFQRIPERVFQDVDTVVLFTAQSRVPPCGLVEEAVRRSIPVIAIEEVHAMMLEQGYVNNYVLPVDHLFVMSEYEKEAFLETGIPQDVISVTGNIFRGADHVRLDERAKNSLKKDLGIDPGRPVATLGLAFLSPHNETIRIRRRLIECAARGLPPDYNLLIKPHPSEQDRDFNGFVHSIAPRARISNPKYTIDQILDITDIFLNRGNSQTVIDALERGVPVIPIPAGRATFFDGMLDEIIVSGEGDIKRAVDLVTKRGMALYDKVFDRFLSVKPEESLARVVSGIRAIAGSKKLRGSSEKLSELALFWAWMGHAGRGLKTLEEIKDHNPFDKTIFDVLRRLISGEAGRREIPELKRWAGGRYKEWILRSLWIKILYDRNEKMDAGDREWFADYPPKMNTIHFGIYTELLFSLYIRSGFYKEAEDLAARLHSSGFADLPASIQGPSFSRLRQRLKTRIRYSRYFIAKEIMRRVGL